MTGEQSCDVSTTRIRDPGNLGTCQTQDHLINNIPGADGLPHTRLPEASHFLQDDQGAEIARRIVELMESN